MVQFSITTLSLLLLSLIHPLPILTAPAPPPPFKIQILAPTLPLSISHNSTLYLTTTGTITNNITLAATAYLQFNSLYIGTSGSPPVGVAIGSLSTRLKGFQGAANGGGQGVIYTTWGIDNNQILSWKNTAFTKQGGDGRAHFWVRMNSIGDVFAIMGGAMTADSVPARLKAVYLWDLKNF